MTAFSAEDLVGVTGTNSRSTLNYGVAAFNDWGLKEALIYSVLRVVRQANHERNKMVTVRPGLVEGFNQRLLNGATQKLAELKASRQADARFVKP